jgi:small subunit ribosomal protein S1
MTTTETSNDHPTPEAREPLALSEPAATPEPATSAESAEGAAEASDPGEARGGAPLDQETGGEPTTNGESTSAEESEESATTEGADAAGPNAGAAGPDGGHKKKRRRRRKKKPGEAGAAATGPADASASSTAEEEAPAAEADAGATGAAPATRKPHERDKKKERKHAGPPRERPPVNIGDIVFGKILEITDEAILVDIPGKAKAIFDRREMMIVDEEEASPPGSRVGPRAAAAEPTAEPSEAGGASPSADEGATGSAEAPPDANTDVAVNGMADEALVGVDAHALEEGAAPATHADEALEASRGEGSSTGSPLEDEAPQAEPHTDEAHAEAPVAAEGADQATAEEAPPETAAEDAPPPLQRDPKVPRVILEVGADFIAVVHNDGARGGLVVLTHHPNRGERAKPNVERAFNEKAMIDGLVTGVIKGGIEADVDGLRAFAPGSHVDLRLGADLSHLVGKRLPFFVTQYAKRGRDIVLSRRSLLEEEAKKARAEALARLKIGDEMDGVVRSVVPFGAFVDIGGIEGLVPLQEMSHNRADGPSDVFKAGEPTRVKVIKIDDKGKIWLSHKATIPDPWQAVAEKYAHGTKHTGKVARLQPFGAFIELEPGVDGLIHLADLSIQRIESPGEVVKVGDSIEVVVSHLDAHNHKIALHPAPTGEAAGETPQRVILHKPVKARIVGIESGGLVVRILGVTGRNSRGYITAAGTGTPRGTELRKAFKLNQDIEAKVIELDPRRGEVKLSIKALSEEQERSAYQQYRQQLKAEARFTFADLLAKKGPPQR